VSVQARKLEFHVRDQLSVQNNSETATDAPYDCNAAEHRPIKTTREDAY
jgi:hypothetical protein